MLHGPAFTGDNDSFYVDRNSLKHVHDNVHGNIFLDPVTSSPRLSFYSDSFSLFSILILCVDSEALNIAYDFGLLIELRDLKQLGLTHMVYPGAVHSRFEHSLGVYWLAGKAIDVIKEYQGNELGIERSDVLAVKLAGLLHDVGHGPFGNAFEHGFLPLVLGSSTWSHEEMSVKMIDHIVDKHNIDIDAELLKKVKEMITPRSDQCSQKVVENRRNGIDVDKFDYIVRDSRACGLGCNFHPDRLMETMQVIGEEICYPAKDYLTIHKLFSTRADLHRIVYTHSKVKMEESILKEIEYSHQPELKEPRDLILRIRRRDLYQNDDALIKPYLTPLWQFCNEFSVPKENLDHFRSVTPQDIVCSQTGGPTLKVEDIAVSNVKIDFTCGRENPLERIKFFKDSGSNEKFPITDDSVSHLLPASYQDLIVKVYSKKPELVEAVSAAFENYQKKIFGRNAQGTYIHTYVYINNMGEEEKINQVSEFFNQSMNQPNL
ncbi:hypothetical protein RIF29_36264 [Crotalaria pallida]|uniref:HD domain-containing protein n=1 Tax=Crotalaria pallida TaxID=3830 RepID=A0AAN9EAX0_CROPI